MQVMQLLQCSRHGTLNTNPYGQDPPDCTVVVRSTKFLKATREVKQHQCKLHSDYTSVQNNGTGRAKASPGEALERDVSLEEEAAEILRGQ